MARGAAKNSTAKTRMRADPLCPLALARRRLVHPNRSQAHDTLPRYKKCKQSTLQQTDRPSNKKLAMVKQLQSKAMAQLSNTSNNKNNQQKTVTMRNRITTLSPSLTRVRW